MITRELESCEDGVLMNRSRAGKEYVEQAPFNMPATYEETSPQTPTFFVLFPGVDPTPWVEDLGKEFGISESEGTFCNISMGQGQEKPAEAIVERYAKNGGWVMLQNCHLMSSGCRLSRDC